MIPGMISIPLEEYANLQDDSDKLSALETAGVDSWSGYGEAMSILDDMRAAQGES